jgi:hypothetical protein
MQVELKGTAPWSLTYTDGTQSYTIQDINTSTISIPVNPTKTTTYRLTGLTDGNGLPGIVFGEQIVKVKSAGAMTIYPTFDTYINDNTPNSLFNQSLTGNIKKAAYAREAFFRYDISEFTAKDSIDMGSLSVYFLSNDKGAPVVLSLYSIEGGMPGDIVDLCWANKPNEINYKLISDVTLPDPGFMGVRASWNVSSYVNKKLKEGAGMVDFSIKSTGGETASLLTWRQYAADSTKWESQHPMLELDPYLATGISPLYGNGSESGFLKMYPNPVKDGYFYIDTNLNATKVKIFNMAGILVRDLSIVNNKVNVSDVENGVYLIQIKADSKTYRGKFMIQ